MVFKRRIVILCLFAGFLTVKADEKKTCLIFSGTSGDEYAVDLDSYNRIHFVNNGMRLTNSENPDDAMSLLYEAYNRFKIDESYVTHGLQDLINEYSRLNYIPSQQSLTISGNIEEEYKIEIFDLNGVLVLNGTLSGDDFISVEKLHTGIYVAVAVGNQSRKTLKFTKQ